MQFFSTDWWIMNELMALQARKLSKLGYDWNCLYRFTVILTMRPLYLLPFCFLLFCVLLKAKTKDFYDVLMLSIAYCGRRGGLLVSVFVSGESGPGAAQSLHDTKIGISSSLMDHLTRIQTILKRCFVTFICASITSNSWLVHVLWSRLALSFPNFWLTWICLILFLEITRGMCVCLPWSSITGFFFLVLRQMNLYVNDLDLGYFLIKLSLLTWFVVYFVCTFQAIHYWPGFH